MADFLPRFFAASEFTLGRNGAGWSTELIWLHNVSDALLCSAYLAIPVVLIFFISRRRDLPLSAIFWLFGAFILGLGLTHLMDVLTSHVPLYRLSAAVKVVTAAVSWATVLALVRVTPRALAMRSPEELERAEAELRDSEQRFRLLAEYASDMISRHAPDGRYLYVSPACRTLLGYAPDELVGRPAAEICHLDDRPKLLQAFALLQQASGPCTLAYRMCHKNGQAIWFETTCRTVRDPKKGSDPLNPKGQTPFSDPSPEAPLDIHAISRDVSERKRAEQALQASLKAKEVLLKELQHRVKNNLQVVSSLLGLQSVHVKDEQARRMFKESQDRVKSIALVHEKCYHSPDLERLAFADYIRSLVLNLFHSYGIDSGRITFQLRADDVRVNLDTAIPCALIINELVSNSLKHAFPSGRPGTISIDLGSDADSRLRLAVRDNGVGLPHGVDIRNTHSLGLQLVSALADQLNGALERRNGEGTTFTITFNELSYKKRS